MTASRPYSRVYHEIVEHPRFERVYGNPHALGTWLQMLLTADAMYPMTPPMPVRTPTVRLLIDLGLVIQRSGNRYSMRGLEAEREHRSSQARNAAAVRWQSDSTAETMPRRDETRREKTSNGANAPTTPFMGFRPRASLSDVKAQEAAEWDHCGQDRCAMVRRQHPGQAGHAFVEQAVTA